MGDPTLSARPDPRRRVQAVLVYRTKSRHFRGRVTGKPEVIGSSVGLVPPNAHVLTDLAKIWAQLGCNKTSEQLPRAPKVAIGGLKLQLVTSRCCTVTAAVSGDHCEVSLGRLLGRQTLYCLSGLIVNAGPILVRKRSNLSLPRSGCTNLMAPIQVLSCEDHTT